MPEGTINQVVPVPTSNVATGNSTKVFLQTIPARLEGGKKTGKATVFLDNGSTNSFITWRKVKELSIPYKSVDPYVVTGFNQEPVTLTHEATVEIKSLNNVSIGKVRLMIVPFVLGVPTEPPEDELTRELSLKGVTLWSDGTLPRNEADVLLGASQMRQVGERKKMPVRTDMWATLTNLGWTLSGCERARLSSESAN
jgi:hypothetical protein